MSGIYIHIPFCKQACNYCNFHFSTSLRLKNEMISAICKEIDLKHSFLEDKRISSIYFGGGTPSLLEEKDLERIFGTLSKHYSWDTSAEVTLEANPDDINPEKLKIWKKFDINRLSIGVQSFFSEDLKWMNRAHTADEAETSIKQAQDSGFLNLTIDLIYGSPTTKHEMWQENIQRALLFNIPHISSYALTVEEKTKLKHQISKKQVEPPCQEKASIQFDYLIQTLKSAEYRHYEISNFSLDGFQAVHNTSYWKGLPYLGLGPSAHSFNGNNLRSWNIANNKKYIDLLQTNTLACETENLTTIDQYNEYVMIGLRTEWGVNEQKIITFGEEAFNHFLKHIDLEIQQNFVQKEDKAYKLTDKGKHFADGIAMRLFLI